jgi:hypothetical protein
LFAQIDVLVNAVQRVVAGYAEDKQENSQAQDTALEFVLGEDKITSFSAVTGDENM